MAIAASAVLLLLAIAAYWRLFLTRGAWWLLGLRVVVTLLLSAVLVGNVLERRWTVTPDRVVVLVDRSESMADAGLEQLAAEAALAFPIARHQTRELWGFGDSAYPVRGPGSDFPGGGRTEVGQALAAVSRTRPGAVVLISDGQDNGTEDPVALARESGIPVYAVGCGRYGERNIGASTISLPAVVYAGDTVDVRVRVRFAGLEGQQAVVRLNEESRRIQLRDEAAERELVFRVEFPRPGVWTIRLGVDSLPGEVSYLDNERAVTVEVKPSRLSVAYLSNRPGPGSRFMLRSLKQDRRIGLASAAAASGTVSLSREGLRRADVFVLDGLAETSVDAGLWQELLSEVRQGKGAIVLAGPGFSPGAQLKKLLPGETGVNRISGSLVPEPSRSARVLPWLTGLDFENLPPFAVAFVPGPADGIEPWLRAGDSLLACAYTVGQGRVVYVAGSPLWRWAFGRGTARPTGSSSETESGPGDALSAFLLGAVRFLASSGMESFVLEAGKPGYYLGEPVRVVLRAVAPGGRPWAGLDPTLSTDSKGPKIPMIEHGGGVYQATLTGLGPGEHEIQALVLLGDSVLGKAETRVEVADRPVELSETGLDESLLRAVARASGGEYFRWDSLPSPGLRPRLASIERGFSFDPRRTPWVYALIALIAGLEWLLRRRRGLL